MRRNAIAAIAVLLLAGCAGFRGSQESNRVDHPDRFIIAKRVTAGSIHWQQPAFRPKGLEFASARHGWLFLASSRALETRDGGRSWEPSSPGRTLTLGSQIVPNFPGGCRRGGESAGATSFWSRSGGYAVCGSQPGAGRQLKSLYKTGDGGKIWKKLTSSRKLPGSGYVKGIRFFDSRTGFLLTTHGIYRTVDGGSSWRQSFAAYSDREAIYWAWPDARDGYVASWAKGAYVTHDLGRTWQRIWPETLPVSFAAPGDAIAAAPASGSGTPILHSTDAGRSWKSWGAIHGAGTVTQLVRLTRRSAVALAAGSWTGYGRLSLFRSDDNGRSWRALAAPETGATDAHSVSLSFAGVDGLLLDPGHGRLFVTHDGGASWELVHKHPSLSTVLMLDEKHFLAVTRQFVDLWASDDGGNHWLRARVGAGQWGTAPNAIAASDSRHIWIASGDSYLLRTVDGGKHWRAYRFELGFEPVGLSFVSPSTGFMNMDDTSGRANQPALMTRDGGKTWTLLPLASRPLR